MTIENSYGMTKKDLFNAKSSALNIKDYLDTELTITGCAVAVDDDKDVGYFVIEDIGVVGVTSATLIDSIGDLIDYMVDSGENSSVVAKVTAHTSKAGKEFYTLSLV